MKNLIMEVKKNMYNFGNSRSAINLETTLEKLIK